MPDSETDDLERSRRIAQSIISPGTPTQTSISSSDNPVSANMDFYTEPQEVVGQTPGYRVQALASLPRDTDNRVRFFARNIFPNLTTAESMQRFGLRDGRIFYINDNGDAIWAEPDFDFSLSASELLNNVSAAGRMIGPALPSIGGIAGGIATAETGPGSIGGAAVGGAAGESLRQGLGSLVSGGNEFDPWRIGGAAITEGAGQVLGLGAARFLAGSVGRVPMAQLSNARRVDQVAGNISGNTPFRLTRAEASGNRALMRRQQYLSQYGGEGNERLNQFYRVRNVATRDALERYLGTFATEESGYLVNAEAIAIAGEARRRATAELSESVRPYYQAAEAMTDPVRGGRMLNPQPVVQHIDELLSNIPSRSGVARVLRATRGNLTEENGGLLTVMDGIKKELDAAILSAGNRAGTGSPGSSVAAGNVHYLSEIRDSLVSEIDRQIAARGPVVVTEAGGREVQIPDGQSVYAVARNIFEEGVPARSDAQNGIIGRVADLRGNRTLEAAGLLMNPNSSSVEQIRAAREYMIGVEGGEQAWDNLLASWLRNAFDGLAERETVDGVPNLATGFLNAVARNPRQSDLLIAATEHNPEMQQGLQWILEAFGSAAQVPRGGSQTAFMAEAGREMTREGRRVGTGVPRAASNLVSVSEWGRILDELSSGRHMARIAELLTTPDGLRQLRAAREISPSGRNTTILLAHILNGGVLTAGESVLGRPADRAPEVTVPPPATPGQSGPPPQ